MRKARGRGPNELGGNIAQPLNRAHLSNEPEGNGHRRVELPAADRTEAGRQDGEREAVGEGDPQEAHLAPGLGVHDHGSRTNREEEEGADRLGGEGCGEASIQHNVVSPYRWRRRISLHRRRV